MKPQQHQHQPTKQELDELESIEVIEETSGYSWRDLQGRLF